MVFSSAIFRKRFALLVFLVLVYNCATTGTTVKSKTEEARLESLMKEKNFVVTSDWAMPMMTNSMNSIMNSNLFPPGGSTNQINLIGNANYLKVMEDSVAAYLPYFGERQMGGGYNNDGPGIQFNGIAKQRELKKNEKTGGYDLRFKINNGPEAFNVNVTISPNLNSAITINSSQRFPIRYSGSVAAITEE